LESLERVNFVMKKPIFQTKYILLKDILIN